MLIARGKLQPGKMGCPEEEHVVFFCLFSYRSALWVLHTQRVSGEVLKLGLSRETLVKLVAAGDLK